MATERPFYIVNVEAVVVRGAAYLMIVRGAEESHMPGALCMPGGKVEDAGFTDEILEKTARREVLEETGVEVDEQIEYLESKSFVADDGEPVVDIVFLCRYRSGTPTISDPGEVAAIEWLTAEEILADPRAFPWTRRSIELAEQRRLARPGGPPGTA